jgi:succinate dehydrogenase / fumarate reductase cytochrome b subunit
MASAERPLSPHLQIYKPQISSVLSILHRITGAALGIGLLLLAWWLIAAASGPDAFATVQGFIGSWLGRTILFGFTWALFYHLLNGIRHLGWDLLLGLDLPTMTRTGWTVVIGSVVLTILTWIVAYAVRG